METLKPDTVYTVYGVSGLLCKFALNPIFNSYTEVTLVASGESRKKGLKIYVRDTLFNDNDVDVRLNIQVIMNHFIRDFRLRQNIVWIGTIEDVRGLQYMTRLGIKPYHTCIRIGDTFYPTVKIAASHLGMTARLIKSWCSSESARSEYFAEVSTFFLIDKTE